MVYDMKMKYIDNNNLCETTGKDTIDNIWYGRKLDTLINDSSKLHTLEETIFEALRNAMGGLVMAGLETAVGDRNVTKVG